MHIAYEERKFSNSSLLIISQADDIIKEYEAQGFTLTLRQLYYQFVARDLIPNTVQSYKRVGSIINDARMAGMISWEAIEDRTRNLKSLSTWVSPSNIIRSAAYWYRIDKWQYQTYRPEVWIEKEALVGVIAGVCEELQVPYFACRGYNSQSEQWAAGRRMLDYSNGDQTPIIFHFGDHDPSGIDMTRDNTDRLEIFAEQPIIVERLALNSDQVRKYNPPPNPAKATDSRYESYRDIYGEMSWELDALEPRVIVDLVRKAILGVRSETAWTEAIREEEKGRKELQAIADGM